MRDNSRFASWWAEKLLHWYSTNGRTALPWKTTDKQRAPWYALVSEIMLQQTQVSRVAEYFVRFIDAFPDAQSLARASEQQVISKWSGLGYYRRARYLHQSAKVLQQWAAQGEGFPRDPKRLVQLPGIGRSTANAILAQAFDQPLPILDANVRRILIRLYNLRTPDESGLWDLASQLQPNAAAADYCQAMMDFGSLVCCRTPLCTSCFARPHCQAYQLDGIQKLVLTKTVSRKTMRYFFAVVIVDTSVWLESQGTDDLWPHTLMPLHALTFSELTQKLRQRFDARALRYRGRSSITRLLTHRVVKGKALIFSYSPHALQAKPTCVVNQSPPGWYGLTGEELPLSSLAMDLLNQAKKILPNAESVRMVLPR